MRLEAIASRLEASAIRLEAVASRLEASAIRLEAITSRLEAVAIRLEANYAQKGGMQLCSASPAKCPIL